MRSLAVLLILLWMGARPPDARSAPASGALPVVSGEQWERIRAEFETSALELSGSLDRIREERETLGEEIRRLEERILALRNRSEAGLNVIDEIRLKGFLNTLRDKLERDSELRRREGDLRRDFEQAALSLAALYNERIEGELGRPVSTNEPKALDARLSELADLIRKRGRIQALLRRHVKKDEHAHYPSLASVESLQKDDRESLQMTLDHLQDRKRDLEGRLERGALEEREILEEIMLQSKMQDFLEEIRRVNEDSDLPRGGPHRGDLERMLGRGQKGRLEQKLSELRERMERDRTVLAQVTKFMTRIQKRLADLNQGVGP
jgi:hypothetical protein